MKDLVHARSAAEVRDVKGFEGLYQVTDQGAVISLRTGREVRPRIVSKRYHEVRLYRAGTKTRRYIHKVVADAFLGPANGLHVDHINGDKLDNRLANLRYCTISQNNANRVAVSASGYRGVMQLSKGRWRAVIQVTGKRIWLGSFHTPEDAARAYDAVAFRHYGDFALTNFGARP